MGSLDPPRPGCLGALRTEFTGHIEILAMTQATVFPPPEQAENVLRKNCWRVSTHSSWFLTFSSSLSVSPASASRSQRKKLVGIIWYLHPTTADHPNPSLSLLGDLEFRFYSLITPSALDSGPHNIHIAHFFSSSSPYPSNFTQNTSTIKTGSRNRAVSNSRNEIASCDPHGRPVLQSCPGPGERTVRIPARPQPAAAADPPRPRLKYCKLGSQASRAQPGPGPEALQRFRFAILRHRFAPTTASCTDSDLQILTEMNLHTKPSDWTKTIDVLNIKIGLSMSVLKMTESRVFNCHVAIDKVVKIGQSQ